MASAIDADAPSVNRSGPVAYIQAEFDVGILEIKQMFGVVVPTCTGFYGHEKMVAKFLVLK